MNHSTRRLASLMFLGLPLLLAVGFSWAQEEEPAPFEIRLPPEIRSEQVQLFYVLAGPPAGTSGWLKPEPERNSYLIDASVDHHPADSLTAILYAPGCQIMTFTLRSSPESEKTREVYCEDLPTITFNGRVELPEALRRRPYEVEIRYMAFWTTDFLHSMTVLRFRLARVTPDEHGAFHVQLPNFTKDAVTESYHRNAWIRFAAVERDTGNFVCLLTPANVQGKISAYDLPIKPKYPNEVIFKPRAESPQNQIIGPKQEELR